MQNLVEHAVERATTDKLEALLNSVTEKGREVLHIEFTGGRDWVVVSARQVPLGWGPDARSYELPQDDGMSLMSQYAELPPSPSFAVIGGPVDELNLAFGVYDSQCRSTAPDGTTRPLRHEWAGYVEDKDRSWILFLDGLGRPALFWPNRDTEGGVIGEPIHLQG